VSLRERLGQQAACAGSTLGSVGGLARRQAAHRAPLPGASKQGEQASSTPSARVPTSNSWSASQRGSRGTRALRAPSFPLGERWVFDAAAGNSSPPAPRPRRRVVMRLGRLGQVQLDHLRRQDPTRNRVRNSRAGVQQVATTPVQVPRWHRPAARVAFAEDRGAETGFGENHPPRPRLDQVAQCGSDHRKKASGMRDATRRWQVESTEDLPLAAFTQQGGRGRRLRPWPQVIVPSWLIRPGSRCESACQRERFPSHGLTTRKPMSSAYSGQGKTLMVKDPRLLDDGVVERAVFLIDLLPSLPESSNGRSETMGTRLGMIETRGLLPAIEAADAMTKAALKSV